LCCLAGPALAQGVRTDLYVTNGTVKSVVEAGGVIYLGGHFTQVGPATGAAVPLDSSTALPMGLPKVVGVVNAVAPDGVGGWYVGGSFSHVGGQPRSHLAHIRADHTVSPWNPNPDDVVYALAVSAGTVYVGGTFDQIGGQVRASIAAVDAATGLATAWNPGTPGDGAVFALAVDGTTVYAGGSFLMMGGQARSRLAAVSAATGLATSWNAGCDLPVRALAVARGYVYAGGEFTTIRGQSRNRIAAVDTLTGDVSTWNPNANGTVRALAVRGVTTFAGGDFTFIGGQPRAYIAALALFGVASTFDAAANNPVLAIATGPGLPVYAGGWFTSIGGQARNFLAKLDPNTGLAQSWSPNANSGVFALAASGDTIYAGGYLSSVGGQTRNRIAALDATTGMPTAWNPDADSFVWALAVRGNTVYAAGNFTTIGGQARNYLAALDATTGLATAWNPDAGQSVETMTLAGQTLFVAGNFTTMGGQSRLLIAAVDAISGAVLPWNPGVLADVWVMAETGGTLYVGGEFTSIGGQPRNRIAALDAVTGAVLPWNPNANNEVWALAVSDSTVYVGGMFTSIGGQSRNRIAALDASTGLATAWNPDANGTVYALRARGGTMYAGGGFTTIGGQARDYLAALDANGTATDWNPAARSGPVNVLAPGASCLYAGGNFRGVGAEPQAFVAGVFAAPVIDHVSPDRGGNAGPVSVTVTGTGFQTGAMPVLANAPLEIEGQNVVVAGDGTTVTATFDLAGASVGAWDVVVTLPDDQKAECFGCFTVETVEAAQLRADLVGPRLIRASRATPYDVVIRNEGNVDAEAVPLWIAGVPPGATLAPDFTLAYPPQAGGEPDWSLVPATLSDGSGIYTAVVIPRVPPGTTVLRFHLTVAPGTNPFQLLTAVAPAWEGRPELGVCLNDADAIDQPSCMGGVLSIVGDTLAAHPEWTALSGIGLWAKVGWACEGAASLAAAIAEAQETMDFVRSTIQEGTASGACTEALLPRWRDTLSVTVVFAVDPNDKLGPHGSVARDQSVPYSVRFENLETASADAQQVVVVDALDLAAFDPATASLDAITFGDVRLVPPPGLASYSTEVDLRPMRNVLVRVSASVDRVTGVLTWTFTSIDPETGQPPLLDGFLPPNQNPPEGEGSVLFTVRPQPLVDGVIRNDAVINFDGLPVDTPEWVNPVDLVVPSSAVLPLSSPADSTRFTVRWEGAGEGIRDFTVYVSEDGGPYRVWRQNTKATADTFASIPGGRTYAFYSVARDENGNVEPAPPVPDAETLSPTVGVGDAAGPPEFALDGARPNPAVGALHVWFTLANGGRAALEVVDVAGRLVARREVGTLGPGRHRLDLSHEVRRPGLYFLRLAQAGRIAHARVVRLP
jgi:hypothetical protein